MLENKVYSFSELKDILNEANQRNEFNPKYGKGYSAKTEGNENEKAVKDITTQAQKSYGGVEKRTERKTNSENVRDKNKTTLDYNYAYEPSDSYKKRVKALAHGYPSESAEENADKKEFEKVGDFDGNKNFYDERAKSRKEDADKRQEDKHAGLKSHNLPKETFKDKTLFTEDKKMKRLHFKNTTFLNEEQMIKRIPDDYKFDGNKFLMKDSKGNEYLVECKKDAICESYIHTNVLGHKCGKQIMSEAFEKFNHLTNYRSSNYNTAVEKIEETKKYGEMLGITRAIKEKEGKK